MQLQPRDRLRDSHNSLKRRKIFRCRWTRSFCCCGSLTPSILVLLVLVFLHTIMLVLSVLAVRSQEDLIEIAAKYVDTKDQLLHKSEVYLGVHEAISKVNIHSDCWRIPFIFS